MIRIKQKVDVFLIFDNAVALAFALRAITYVWLAFASDIYMPIYAFCVIILRCITVPLGLFYFIFRQRRVEKEDTIILLPVIYYWLLLVFNTYGGYKGSYIHELVSIGCFVLMKQDMKIRIFKLFFNIILFVNAIAVIIYILYIARFPIGVQTLPFFNDGVQTTYYKRWFIVAIIDSGYSLPRLCGIFNEPGALGTVCALLFAISYRFTNRLEKSILLSAILCSFSLAGYFLVIVYLIIYYSQKDYRYGFICISLIVLLIVLPHIDWHNEDLNYFAHRFSITMNGLAGDNRTRSAFNEEYNNLIYSNSLWFGKGANYEAISGTSSYKNYIMQFGVIGFGIYILLWLHAGIKHSHRDKDCFIFLLIFLISFYQRPVTIVNTYGYVLVFGGITWLLSEKTNYCKCMKNIAIGLEEYHEENVS